MPEYNPSILQILKPYILLAYALFALLIILITLKRVKKIVNPHFEEQVYRDKDRIQKAA